MFIDLATPLLLIVAITIIATSFVLWPNVARLVRSQTLLLSERPFDPGDLFPSYVTAMLGYIYPPI